MAIKTYKLKHEAELALVSGKYYAFADHGGVLFDVGHDTAGECLDSISPELHEQCSLFATDLGDSLYTILTPESFIARIVELGLYPEDFIEEIK